MRGVCSVRVSKLLSRPETHRGWAGYWELDAQPVIAHPRAVHQAAYRAGGGACRDPDPLLCPGMQGALLTAAGMHMPLLECLSQSLAPQRGVRPLPG